MLKCSLSGTTSGHELKPVVESLALLLTSDDGTMPPNSATFGYQK